MISGVIKNSAINAKVHAKLRGTLKKEDYEKLVTMRSVPEAAEYLKNNTRYEKIFRGINIENIHRGQLESLLHTFVALDLQSFFAFSGTSAKFFLSLFGIKDETAKLKIMLRRLKASGTAEPALGEISAVGFSDGVDFTALANAKDFDSFAAMLSDTIYGKVFSGFIGQPERQSLFEIENALDLFYRNLTFSYMNKYLSKEERRLAERTLGTETDIENIMLIVRAKKYYGKRAEMIYPYLVSSGYRLKKDDIRRMAEAETEEKLLEALSGTCYAKLFEDGTEEAERKISAYSLSLHGSSFRKNPYSIEAILYFMKLKQTEIKNIIMIIEGIRYGMEPDKIKGCLIGAAGAAKTG